MRETLEDSKNFPMLKKINEESFIHGLKYAFISNKPYFVYSKYKDLTQRIMLVD